MDFILAWIWWPIIINLNFSLAGRCSHWDQWSVKLKLYPDFISFKNIASLSWSCPNPEKTTSQPIFSMKFKDKICRQCKNQQTMRKWTSPVRGPIFVSGHFFYEKLTQWACFWLFCISTLYKLKLCVYKVKNKFCWAGPHSKFPLVVISVMVLWGVLLLSQSPEKVVLVSTNLYLCHLQFCLLSPWNYTFVCHFFVR